MNILLLIYNILLICQQITILKIVRLYYIVVVCDLKKLQVPTDIIL